MPDRFEKLLSPIRLGALELKNRIAMPPMTMAYADSNDGVSQQHLDYYGARAKGGVGMVIVGGVTVEGELGKLSVPAPLLRLDRDKYVAGFNRLTDTIHDNGAKAVIQLYNAGRQTTFENTGGRQPVCSSDCCTMFMGVLPLPDARAMTLQEVEQMEDNYVAAAQRARIAGFDAILIDGGGGYGIAQFMSERINKRTDKYGGDLEGRMRFPLNIIKKIQAALGPQYPLLFDLPADEYVEGGISLAQSVVMAQMLEQAGILAFRLHVGCAETYHYVIPPACISAGYMADMADEIRKGLKSAKIMLGHRIHTPRLAESLLQKQKADIVLMGRPLIADPELPRKVAEGRTEDIRQCISCNVGCAGRISFGLPVSCTVNPAVGKEATYKIVPAAEPKKVLIVGGGVGGMEAARVAALRGHQVTLCEKSPQLGGMLNVAAIPPYKSELHSILKYYEKQFEKLDLEIRLDTEMTAERALQLRPDAVVVATGAGPLPVGVIPGAEAHKQVVSWWDVVTGKADVGQQVAVIGGGSVGLETAEFLCQNHKSVKVIEMLPQVGIDMDPFTMSHMIPRLIQAGVQIMAGTRVETITAEGVRAGGELIAADTVVIAIGLKSNDLLGAALKGRVPELHLVGDCIKPRRLIDAIREGFWAATRI